MYGCVKFYLNGEKNVIFVIIQNELSNKLQNSYALQPENIKYRWLCHDTFSSFVCHWRFKLFKGTNYNFMQVKTWISIMKISSRQKLFKDSLKEATQCQKPKAKTNVLQHLTKCTIINNNISMVQLNFT